MRTGEVVRDPQGRSFQIGQLLGRGLWGRTYAAKEEGGGEWALKVPLTLAELGEGGERLARAVAEAAVEEARFLEQHTGPGIVPCEASFRTAEGVPVLVMPRYPSSLERRMALGCSFEEVLRVVVEATRALRGLSGVAFHGALKPNNVLLNERGEVRLTDFVTPALRRHLGALIRATGQGSSYLAPEVRAATGEDPPLSSAADSYALAMMIYRGVLTVGGGAAPTLPEDGLDKAALVALKDRIHNRLKAEPSNPRFHNRLADRAAALLNRALSREVTPSPPFRFARLDEFLARAEEVAALVHPIVTHVGKLLLDRPPANETFTTDEESAFSCTIACSTGVETHEEIATGLALFDHDRDERLRDVACSYTVDRHPSGRFRFGFRIADLPPATYRVRLAFTIRDSGHEPVTAEGRFVVRAAPGYVPPRAAPEARPIPMERPPETSVTDRRSLSAVTGSGVTGPGVTGSSVTGSGATGFRAPVEAPRVETASRELPRVASAPPVEAPRPEPPRPAPRPEPVRVADPVEIPRPAPVRAPDPVEIPRPAARPLPSIPRPEPVVRLAPPPPEEDVVDEEMDDYDEPALPPPPPPAARRPAPPPAAELDDPGTDTPEYRGAGRWTDLPVPGYEPRARRDEDAPDEEVDELATGVDTSATSGWRSAIVEPLQRILDLARGEAYWLYIGGAVLVILVMLVALLALGH